MTRRLAPFATLAVTAALARSACGDDAPAEPTEPTTVTVTNTPEAEVADAPEQQELTAKKLKAALPTLEEAPAGFVKHPDGFDAALKSKRTTDPETCLAAYFDTPEIREWRDKHVSEGEGVRYAQKNGGTPTPQLSVAIWTFDEPYPKRFFDEAGASLAECTTFTSAADPDANDVEQTAQHIGSPVVGDQTFGVRIGNEETDLAIDYIWVRSGHNLINARMITGFRANNEERLGTFVTDALEDLK